MAAEMERTNKTQPKPKGPEVGSRTLTGGERGHDVDVLQRLVVADRTGVYDPATVKAVKVWQKHRGLTPTGVVGPDDWKRVQIDLKRK